MWADPGYHFGRFVVRNGGVTCDGQRVNLTRKQYVVLLFLLANRHRVVTPDDLHQACWPDVAIADNTIYKMVWALRDALGERGDDLIKTVWGRGFQFVAQATEDDPTENRRRARDQWDRRRRDQPPPGNKYRRGEDEYRQKVLGDVMPSADNS